MHGPKDLRVEDVQESPVGPGEVAVDIAYGGICGSDLHYWQHGRNGSFEVNELPMLGHEVVGRVRELWEGIVHGMPNTQPAATVSISRPMVQVESVAATHNRRDFRCRT